LNARPKLDADISSPDSRVRVLLIQAEEDWAIAAEDWRIVRAPLPSRAGDANPSLRHATIFACQKFVIEIETRTAGIASSSMMNPFCLHANRIY